LSQIKIILAHIPIFKKENKEFKITILLYGIIINMLNQLQLNSILIAGCNVIIDVFWSKKCNGIVIIFNNKHYIKQKTDIDIFKIKWKINDLEWNILSFLKMENTNSIPEIGNKKINDVLYDGFHIEIAIIPNISINQKNISFLLKELQIDITIDEPILDFYNKKCLTTIQKDEVKYIPNWIDYHKKLGFNLFIIYDNNFKEENYNNIIDKYSDCLYVINANFDYWLNSYGRSSVGQVIQQNHCIWKYVPHYLGLTDLDEYIYSNVPIFQENVNVLSFPNRWFGCGNGIHFTPDTFLSLLNKCETYNDSNKWQQRKCIIQPMNVDLFCVHIAINYKDTIKYLSITEAYLRHYFILSTKKRNCNCNIYCKVYNPIDSV
jgi:hypothetical protein